MRNEERGSAVGSSVHRLPRRYLVHRSPLTCLPDFRERHDPPMQRRHAIDTQPQPLDVLDQILRERE